MNEVKDLTEIFNLIKYYRGCVSEEVKNSAFINLTKENSIRVALAKGNKLTENYPTPTEFPESSKQLLELMLSASVDTRKELIYATAFIKQRINSVEVNAPLLYCPCEITRDKSGVVVSLASEVWHVNAGIIAVVTDKQDEEVKLLMKHLPTINASGNEINEWLKEFTEYFSINTNATLKTEIICLTMPKASAGMLNDLDKIASADDCLNTSLRAINDEPYIPNPVSAPLSYINTLAPSQVRALEVACRSNMSAIIGAPGTGKSNTIVGIATHLIANGHSVLIASKMNEAVDVVFNRLSIPKYEKFPYVVRTGSKEYRKELANILDSIVDGKYAEYMESLDTCYGSYTKDDLIHQEKKVKVHNDAVEAVAYYEGLIEGLKARKREFSKSYLISRIDLISAQHKLKEAKKIAEDSNFPYETAYLDVYRLSVFTNQLVNNMANLMTTTSRRELISMSRMLKSGKLTEDYDNYFKALVSHGLPCWLTTINSVSESIPCIAGLFDYVIIDEASQCDIGSCIPLLYRAKRAIIVGDNKQLKYISFLSNDKNLCYAKNFNISDTELIKFDYTKNSMFDFAQYFADEAPVMLKEHFRSSRPLFGFSNKKFYNGKITCTDKGVIGNCYMKNINVASLPENSTTSEDGTITFVEQDTKYTRNFYEAKAVVEVIKEIIYDRKHMMDMNSTVDFVPSIGVLSPFRAQVDLLQDMINHEISLEDRNNFKILVGTAHAFQGNERDIMLNSWVVAKNTKRQSFTFINNPNLFNVSVTRARLQVINFVSVLNINDIPDGLLKEYIDYCGHNGTVKL